MEVVVGLGPGGSLTVVNADPEHAVVARSLQSPVEHLLVEILGPLGRPVVEDAHPALAVDRRVERVGPVERDPIRARLHVFPAERDLGEPDPDAVDLVFGQVDVAVAVAELGEVDRAVLGPRHPSGEVGLDVEVEPVAQVAREDQPAAADEELVERPDRPVAGMVGGCLAGIVPEHVVQAKLRVATEVDAVIPVLLHRRDVAVGLLVHGADGGIAD